jgi:hypothetical protein
MPICLSIEFADFDFAMATVPLECAGSLWQISTDQTFDL